MIGVLVNDRDRETVAEFFELFKTAWEFYRPGASYDVLLVTGDRCPDKRAKLTLLYGAQAIAGDTGRRWTVTPLSRRAILAHDHGRIPLYGAAAGVSGADATLAWEEDSQEPLVVESEANGEKTVRLGYNLFEEARHLLSEGQPPELADAPTLDLHVEMLRSLILSAGVPVVEIPPTPPEAAFIVCLTHDVDHPSLRGHCWDHTAAGFLYRATVKSFGDWLGGRRSLGQMLTNWRSALQYPLVQLHLAPDFWRQFDRYRQVEKGLASTFFFVPRADDPGTAADGSVKPKRAVKYNARDLAGEMERLARDGHEIGLHGLDAWRDSAKGREERNLVGECARRAPDSVRMHWLWFDRNSPAKLEEAGLSCDSTVGYNQTVGYRAGTSQAYRPPGTRRLLELPMQVMDTAMFYPAYLNLSFAQARRRVDELIVNAERFGGALTINWHDRSLAPERLWDEFYIDTLAGLKQRRVWFATVHQASEWFRMRRAAAITDVIWRGGEARVTVTGETAPGLPGLSIRVHRPKDTWNEGAPEFTETEFDGTREYSVGPAEAAAQMQSLTL